MELMYKRQSLGLEGVPSGCILAYSGEADTVPEGWAVCDGENGTPDLRGRFILGVSETHPMGETGGAEEVTLTVDQMPSHNHAYYLAKGGKSIVSSSVGNNTGYPYLSNANSLADAGDMGSNEPHPNMPPYYALIYIMKL